MPLSQRLPKLPGFKNPFKKVYAVVNVSKLSRFENGARVDAEALVEAGLAPIADFISVALTVLAAPPAACAATSPPRGEEPRGVLSGTLGPSGGWRRHLPTA